MVPVYCLVMAVFLMTLCDLVPPSREGVVVGMSACLALFSLAALLLWEFG